MKRKFGLLSVALASLLAVFAASNAHNWYAYWWKAENATVTLSDCSGGDCELSGTLRIEPWTGNHLLEKPDGSVTTLGDGSYSAISYPVAPGTKM